MTRVAVIGNAGGGKSTLSRALASACGLPYVEIDALLWAPDWTWSNPAAYEAKHDAVLATESWVLDGFGTWTSVERRLAAADTVVLVDLPLWVHFWLAAERQISWTREAATLDAGDIEVPKDTPPKPAGHRKPPPTRDLFELIWDLDRDALPRLRALVTKTERAGAHVVRLTSLEQQEAFLTELGPVDN